MLGSILHLILHLIIPAVVALVWSNWPHSRWGGRGLQLYGLMLLTMAVDIDHLLADPIYDPNRCSLGFHPLHTFGPILLYFVLCRWPSVRPIGVGLIVHMILDSLDCYRLMDRWYMN